MKASGEGAASTFRSLRNRNYRLYFTGQTISMAGTFMQTVAQAWLVLSLTGSGTALGLVAMLQFLPILLLGPFTGLLIDRYDRRKLYILTQSVSGFSALCLGLLIATGAIRLWMVFVFAAVLGLITTVDQPTKTALVYDIVGPEDLPNAVSLNMALNNIGRVTGPALAGLTIAVVGIGWCFIINAASFLAVLVALLLMRTSEFQPVVRVPRTKGQIREGLTVVRHHPELMALLVMAGIFFGLTWTFDVIMPLVASVTFGGGAGLYGLTMSFIGAGAIVGALLSAHRANPTRTMLALTGLAVSAALAAAAIAPIIAIELLVLLVVGAAGSSFMSTLSARLQLQAPADVRGRIMALWMVAAIGTRPLGAPLVGFLAQHLGPRFGLGTEAIGSALAVTVWYLMSRSADHRGALDQHPAVPAVADQPITDQPLTLKPS